VEFKLNDNDYSQMSCVSHLQVQVTHFDQYEFDYRVVVEDYFIGDSFSYRVEYLSDFYPTHPERGLPVLEMKGQFARYIVNLSRLGIHQYTWMDDKAVNRIGTEKGFFILPERENIFLQDTLFWIRKEGTKIVLNTV
jgi:hypothetical protein